jgi:hypothetical protein
MKKNISTIAILFVSMFLFACRFSDNVYLGANYWFWEDGNQSAVVYANESTAQGGFGIIDANVSQYNFDNKYIIAKSNWLIKNGIDVYWIIDKEIKINKDTSLKAELYEYELKKGLIGPLSKDSFELLIHQYHINLKLKDAH